jgi:hypothetical protein
MRFDTNLLITVAGSWRATIGSPWTGPATDPFLDDRHLGARLRSLVLFEHGVVRVVLSDGLIIVTAVEPETTTRVTLSDVFEWAAEGGTVTRWLAVDP